MSRKLDIIWKGWEAKCEHVEEITGCRRDLLAFCLLGASTLLIHQPSLFPQSTNPIILPPQLTTKPSGASYHAAFSMHLWLVEEKKCESWFKLGDSFAETNPTWNCNVECGELDTTSGRGQRLLILLDCGDHWKRINSWKTHSNLAVFLWMPDTGDLHSAFLQKTSSASAKPSKCFL